MGKWKSGDDIVDYETDPGPNWEPVNDVARGIRSGKGGNGNGPRTQYVTLPNGSKALINADTGAVIQNYGGGETYSDKGGLLGSNGYTFWDKPGAGGPQSLWKGPDGRVVTEEMATAQIEKAALASPSAGGSTVGANNWFTASENDKNRTAAATQAAAVVTQQQAELRQRIKEAADAVAQTAQQIAIQQGTLDFTVSKGDFEMSIGRTREARETQGQVFSQQAQIATLQFSMAQAQAQQSQWQAQLDSSTDQFNSTMGFNVDRANVEAEANRQQRLQGLATDIGTLAADPGDRGKYAATVLAAGPGQFGAQDAALGATDLRTQQSLTPLQALLGQRDGVMAESSTPFKYTPVAARQVAPLNFSGINMPTAATAGQFPPVPAYVPPPATPTSGTSGPFVNTAPVPPVVAPSIDQGSWSPGTSGESWLDREGVPDFLKMADGGLAEGAYISGDSNNGKPNEEINIPLGPGQAYVIPKNKVSPAQWKQLQKMAGGGVFSQGTVFGGSTPDTTQASNFLNTASTNARSGTPWAQGKLPTPVYASTPGFDPVVAQLLASLSAQSTGIDQGSFLRLAALQAPTAMQQGVVRRSR